MYELLVSSVEQATTQRFLNGLRNPEFGLMNLEFGLIGFRSEQCMEAKIVVIFKNYKTPYGRRNHSSQFLFDLLASGHALRGDIHDRRGHRHVYLSPHPHSIPERL
jgi:hypothetical protein